MTIGLVYSVQLDVILMIFLKGGNHILQRGFKERNKTRVNIGNVLPGQTAVWAPKRPQIYSGSTGFI